MIKLLTLLTEYVGMCIKLKETNTQCFMVAAQSLSEIQESKGI